MVFSNGAVCFNVKCFVPRDIQMVSSLCFLPFCSWKLHLCCRIKELASAELSDWAQFELHPKLMVGWVFSPDFLDDFFHILCFGKQWSLFPRRTKKLQFWLSVGFLQDLQDKSFGVQRQCRFRGFRRFEIMTSMEHNLKPTKMTWHFHDIWLWQRLLFGIWWNFFSWTFCDQGFAQLQIDKTMKHYNSRPFTNDMCHLLVIWT